VGAVTMECPAARFSYREDGVDTLRVIDDHPCNARNVLGKPATEPWGLTAM
jgi:hypothetical protein